MIHTARQSGKFIKLVRRLRGIIPPDSFAPAESVAIAILERLWHATATGAPRGDVGRFDDEVIAELVGWPREAAELIELLCDCGWLDRDPDHRLLVHDWHDHAPRFVRGNVAKMGGFFTTPREATTASLIGEPNGEPHGQGVPNLTKPNLTIIDRSIARARAGGEPDSDRPTDRPTEKFSGDRSAPPAPRAPAVTFPAPIIAGPITADEWEVIEGPTIEAADLLSQGSPRKASHGDNWALVARCLAFDLRHGTSIVRRVGEAVRRGSAEKPFGYLKSAYLTQCEALGVDGHELLRTMEIPFRPTRRPRGDPAPVAAAD